VIHGDTTYKTRSSAVAVIADHTAYDVRYSWNSLGQHEYLLIYSFKLKSAFDARSLLLMHVSFLAICGVFWLSDTSYSKSVRRSE